MKNLDVDARHGTLYYQITFQALLKRKPHLHQGVCQARGAAAANGVQRQLGLAEESQALQLVLHAFT